MDCWSFTCKTTERAAEAFLYRQQHSLIPEDSRNIAAENLPVIYRFGGVFSGEDLFFTNTETIPVACLAKRGSPKSNPNFSIEWSINKNPTTSSNSRHKYSSRSKNEDKRATMIRCCLNLYNRKSESRSRRTSRPTISLSNQSTRRSETITLFSTSSSGPPDSNPHQGIIPQSRHTHTKGQVPVHGHRPSAVFCYDNGHWSYRAWSLHKRPQHNHLP